MKTKKGILYLSVILLISQIGLVQAQIEDDEFPDAETNGQCIPENLLTPYDSLYNPETPAAEVKKWYSFGSEYYKNKNYLSALPYLWNVFVNDTGKYGVLAIRKIAYSYFTLQIIDSTLIACYKGLERYPNHDNLHYYAGYLQDNLGKFRCAIPHYEKLVEDEPEEKSYLEKLAFLYFKDENEASIEIQQRLIDIDPNNSEYHATMAAYMTHFYGDALEARKNAYKNNPEDINLAFAYGKEAYEQGKYQESIDPLSAVLAKNPQHAEAHKFRGMSLEGLEQFNAAIADYKKILEIEADNAEIMCFIAVDYKNLNQFSNGKYWVNKALQAKSGYGLAYMTLAELYEAAVSYCQDKDNRGRKYDDGLVYQKAYNAYAQAAKDPAYKSDATRRMSSLKPVLPTQEEKFMNQNRKTVKEKCYTAGLSSLKIALGSDHIGYNLKNTIKTFLENKGFSFTDFGTFKINEGDYPEFAYKVGTALIKDDYDRGILIGSSGMGMCITANKLKNIRAAVASDIKSAQQSRLYNDTNVLCLGSEGLPEGKALDIIEIWLNTSFEGGKHQNRIELINQLTGL